MTFTIPIFMDPKWTMLNYGVDYKNTSRWPWEFWKPLTVTLPVFEKTEDGETIRRTSGYIGSRYIEESVDEFER